MKRSKSIEVIVAPDGGIRVEAVGFTGSSCQTATEELERALGQAGKQRRKPEFYQSRSVDRQQRIGGRRQP